MKNLLIVFTKKRESVTLLTNSSLMRYMLYSAARCRRCLQRAGFSQVVFETFENPEDSEQPGPAMADY